MALARRPIYQPVQPQQPVFLNLSQVSDKQVITRNTGKNLGTMGEAWVDPQRLEVVSFEVESKRGVGSSVTGNVPLAMLKQIGDVVLVQDELPPDQVPLDARYGFVKLLGLEVRTRMGRVLGKIRDITFNPDTGAISRIEYDDFGLRFLPVNFFDTFSVPAELVESAVLGYVLVASEGEAYQRQEKQGILSGILRGLGTRPQSMGLLLTDGGRNEVAGYLPQNYTYEKWESDIRRWEAETGMRYEEYMMAQQQRMGGGGPAGMLPAPGGSTAAGYMARGPQQQQQQQQPMGAQPGLGRPGMGMGAGPGQQQQQQQRYGPGPAAAPGTPGGSGATRPGMRPGVPGAPAPGALPPQQPQQQQYGAAGAAPGTAYGAGYGAGADPRFRGAAPAGAAPPRFGGPQQQPAQQQQAGWPAQQQAQQQQQGGAAGWPPAGAPTPVQQRQQPQQQPGGGGRPGAQGAPQQQAAPQQAQQAGQYGWPASDGGAAGGPGAGSGPSASANGNGSGASGGAMRVEEWLAREGVAQPQPVQAEPAAMANGWEGQGGRGGAQY
ncbi:hypothetical protein CHLRE_17g738200v5 [Chlamydomonas reinhardtii]|uniref:PRC-barrel domain-containing protein n=1 Tax=Chlamydomonas reinhardtii TaxID=3055 RepID=A0A2K3CRJ5_CHLRE|nr:uncharacterized protein CHLRE_17g738200v5 [Chlamydomonas reinhardtii]PNW70902.1 hypothetical protein CHLRE_17g738200v5 [Chlamydomonas reinhardtii]